MAAEFEYKEEDQEGQETLEVVAGAHKFNKWMYKTVSKHLEGDVLEIGSGIGNISNYFLDDGKRLYLSDIRESYCDKLKVDFGSHKNCIGVSNVDLVHPQFEEEYKDLLERFNGIFALNVIEHIEDDVLALSNAKKLLKKNGIMVILVPAYQKLYNRFDEELYHFRRYTKNTLEKVFEANDLDIIRSEYFNLFGILGWYVSGKLIKKKTIPKSQMNIYNLLVPFIKYLDKMTMRKIGLSVITIATKK